MGTLRDILIGVSGGLLVWVGDIAVEGYKNHTERAKLIINKRIDVYNKVGESLNDVYVYITAVGHYKDLTPDNIIAIKRATDKVVYSNIPFLSAEFFTSYHNFMNAAFCTYGGVGVDAKIIADLDTHKESALVVGKNWEQRYDAMFSEPAKPDVDMNPMNTVTEKYMAIMLSLGQEMNESIFIEDIIDGKTPVPLHECPMTEEDREEHPSDRS